MTFLFVIGPSGAGKTTWVKSYLQKNPSSLHLDRDGMAKKLLSDQGVNTHMDMSLNEIERLNDLLQTKLDDVYFKQLTDYLSHQDAHIVVDYVPSMPLDWIKKTYQMCLSAGQDCQLVGIMADPEKALVLALERDSENLDLKTKTPPLLHQDRRHFRAWLKTYKNFPDVFEGMLKSMRYPTKMYMSDGSQFHEVATWKDSYIDDKIVFNKMFINDELAYHKYLNLRQIDLVKACFSIAEINTQNMALTHRFSVVTENFYALSSD